MVRRPCRTTRWRDPVVLCAGGGCKNAFHRLPPATARAKVFFPSTTLQRGAAAARRAASAMTQQEKKQSLNIGAGVMIGVIIGAIIENLTMGIGIGIAIGIALSLVNKGGSAK